MRDLDFMPVECKLEHFFSDGIYIRQITMPSGSFIQGCPHKTKHLNVVISGRVLMADTNQAVDAGFLAIQGPCTFESIPGEVKTLYIEEETIWQTIHANDDNERNISILEKRLVDKPLLDSRLYIEMLKRTLSETQCHS